MDLFIARQPATQTTRKQVLMQACNATGIQPRPNWEHPSAREFLAELQLLADVHGYFIGDPLPEPLVPNTRTSYSTMKSWPISKGTRRGVITWDSLKGDIYGDFSGAVWKPLAEHMPEVISRAYANSEIIHNNVIDQIAISFMLSFPCAPFISSGLPGKQKNSLWLAVPDDYKITATLFFETLGRPLLDGMVIQSPTPARIEASCARGCKRLARGSGWVKICQDSHSALLSQL